jgi:putative ABC transport system permease protein
LLRIYWKSAIRQISRSRIYSAINILGLAIGISTMLLAILFWNEETGYDQFHKNNPNLYRVTTTLKESKDADRITIGGTGQVQGPAFKASIPEIKSYTRVMGGDIFSNIIANNSTIKVRPLFVDANFLNVFSFEIIHGNAASALADANSIVLTESSAVRFFKSTNVLGRLMMVDADPSFDRLGKPLIVTAVVKDPPANSSLQFDALYSFDFMQLAFKDEAWLNAYLGTFVLLEPGANPVVVQKKFADVYTVHAKQQLDKSMRDYGYDPEIEYRLQPVTKIHLDPLTRASGNAEGGIINGSDKSYSIAFLVVSGFILMMAAINFVNINLARAIGRSKEVGIRKVSGGSARQIVLQFLMEACMLCVISFILSCLLMYATLPLFNELTQKQLKLTDIATPSILFYFLLLLTGLIAITGLYPAFILSEFRPSEVLYNRSATTGSARFAKMLVVLQFTPAIFLLIASIIYYSQVRYMRTKELGYDPSRIIHTAVYGDRDYDRIVATMRDEMKKQPLLGNVSFGSTGFTQRMEFNGKSFEVFKKVADEQFLPLMKITLAAGKNFSTDDAGSGMIVNEAFVRAAGIAYPVGSLVNISDFNDKSTRKIVGVIKDYHYASPRLPILPMVMLMNKNAEGDIWIKVNDGKMGAAINTLELVYRKLIPGALFEYNILEESNKNELANDRRWQKVVMVGTLLSFVICWLGLFGLAHLSTRQRVKEIGIRKVLGATVSQIVMMLTGNFVRLVMIAFLIASPAAWWVMHNWLRDFAYHINIGWTVFAVAAVMAVTVTIMSVSYQSFRSALSNPVKSLRTE